MGKLTVVPTSKADRDALFKGVTEIVDSITRMKAEQDYQKEAVDELSEKYSVAKKHIKRMAKDYLNSNFDEKQSEEDEYAELYELVCKKVNFTDANE